MELQCLCLSELELELNTKTELTPALATVLPTDLCDGVVIIPRRTLVSVYIDVVDIVVNVYYNYVCWGRVIILCMVLMIRHGIVLTQLQHAVI